jgi:hypothetical protein
MWGEPVEVETMMMSSDPCIDEMGEPVRGSLWALFFSLCLAALAFGTAGCGDDAGGGGDVDGGGDIDGSTTDGGGEPDGGCAHGEPCGPAGVCCTAEQECVNDWQCLPICENVRCGRNLEVCCGDNEICLDGVECAADCPQGSSLCGEQLDTCCFGGDVCLENECVAPGESCSNNFDCLDEGWYCEPTIGQCLPLPQGPLCEGEPVFTDIAPIPEWYWPGITYEGHYYQNILAAPAVGDVNGDTTPDVVVVAYYGTSYTTESIVVVLDGAGDGNGNGEVLFTIPSVDDPTAPKAYGLSAVALANFDDDPGLEIVYNMAGGGIRIADNDGIGDVCDASGFPGCQGVRTTGPGAGSTNRGGPSVADVDHDGMPDVIARCHVLDGHDISDPSLDFVATTGCGHNSVVADLDEDGRPEVIDSSHAITIDPNVAGGVPLWTADNGVTSGFIAVADVIPDIVGPEVVNIYQGFYLLDGQTGEVLIGPGGSLVDGDIAIPGAGVGGPPTVADFDGDGLVEVSTAGLSAYVVYDPDCWDPPLRAGGQCATLTTDLMLWETPTQDLSSSRTGSSVFDFQGDGPAEVLYNDECFFHIYDGQTGQELVDPVIPSSSRTSEEYPLVADVDGDGNAEMIVVSNQDQAISRDNCHISWKDAGVPIDLLCELTECTAGPACTGGVGGTCADAGYQCDQNGVCQLPGGTHGVRVFGDANDRWVKTRPVWNQFAYHVTNFELQSGWWDVPATETPNWTIHNNYRQNVQGGALFPVPDLEVSLTATTVCPTEVLLVAEVRNTGSAGAWAGRTLAFYRIDGNATNPPELIELTETSDPLLPGGWERVSAVYPHTDDEAMTFRVVVDEGEVTEECDEDDNSAEATSDICPGVR